MNPASQVTPQRRPQRRPQCLTGLKDSVADRPNHSNLWTIRILRFCQNSFTIQVNFSEFSRISETLRNSEHFLEYSAKSREIFIKIDAKFDENCRTTRIFSEIITKNTKTLHEFLRRFWIWSGARVCKSCRSRKMLKNEYLVGKIGLDTAEGEPSKVWSFSLKTTEFYCIEPFN